MLPSMFNLDQRIAELHQVGDDLRAERRVREAGGPAAAGRTFGDLVRSWLGGTRAASRPSGLATH